MMNAAWESVVAGVPILLVHLAVTTSLLVCGVTIYVTVAPYREFELIRKGNVAAAIVLSGQTVALAIPLAVMMANSVSVPDIVLWGLVAIILQFVAIVAARLSIPHLPAAIRRGEISAAIVLVTAQLAAALLNAAALSS
jgi:putative membrane protein